MNNDAYNTKEIDENDLFVYMSSFDNSQTEVKGDLVADLGIPVHKNAAPVKEADDDTTESLRKLFLSIEKKCIETMFDDHKKQIQQTNEYVWHDRQINQKG